MSMTVFVAAVKGEASDTKPSFPERQRCILDYLRSNADVKTYFRSRLIADDFSLSAKEVGANTCLILGGDSDMIVEKWGYSPGTTRKVAV